MGVLDIRRRISSYISHLCSFGLIMLRVYLGYTSCVIVYPAGLKIRITDLLFKYISCYFLSNFKLLNIFLIQIHLVLIFISTSHRYIHFYLHIFVSAQYRDYNP